MAKRKRHTARPTGEAVVAEYVDIDVDSYMVMPDGRQMQRPLFGLTEEQVERIRLGYICLQCLEVHDAPFPDECAVCHFPMREKQAQQFAEDFRGAIRFGPQTTDEEEYAIAEEMIQKDAYDRATKLGLIFPKPSIIVPRST